MLSRRSDQVGKVFRLWRAGYFRLRKQEDLILGSDWNVLIVLDACRADYFQRLAPNAEVVWSAARCTMEWMRKWRDFASTLDGNEGILWVTANPVVDRDVARFDVPSVRTIPVWESSWEEIGPQGIPSVHPKHVNEAVRSYLAQYGQPARMIVHYLQPHSPYIGDTPLAVSIWRGMPDELSQRASRLPSPVDAVVSGSLTWQEVRRAYRDNLRLVYDHVNELIPALAGRVFVTSDHGELLGEHGQFGHESRWQDGRLWRVPWLLVKEEAFAPAPVVDTHGTDLDQEIIGDRLRQLGYL